MLTGAATLVFLSLIINDTVTITGFLLAMMLAIEYLNVAVGGDAKWRRFGRGWSQYLLAAGLGALPGCLGPWAVVSLYSHGLMSMGALAATMISTSGDEAFVMLALFPAEAFWLFVGLTVCGIAVGLATDWLITPRRFAQAVRCAELTIHQHEFQRLFVTEQILRQWRTCSLVRAALAAGFGGLFIVIGIGVAGPPEWNWLRFALLGSMGFALFVIATVPDHFLEEHLWRHVLRRHTLRIGLWTLGALIATQFLGDLLAVEGVGSRGMWTMLVVACLVGIIPQSGPHLIFVTLYAKGAVPMSVLLASSIVQDGHGMLPLLAESRRAFVITKAINLLAGFAIGAAALALGF